MLVLAALALSLQQPALAPLGLAQALELAHARRAAGQVAAADVARARGGLRLAGAVPNPVGAYSYTEDLPRQHVSLEQSFDWLLTRGPDRGAARADLARALADSTQGAADLTEEVRIGFYTALAAVEVERLTGDQARLADSLVTIARARLARGDIPLLEQEQLALEATRTAQRLARAREAADVARSRVAQLIGWNPAEPLPPLVGDLAEGSEAENSNDSATATPRLLAARADAVAAAERARSAGRSGVPLPTLQVGADWDDPTASHTPLAVLGFSIPVPLWQHGGGASAVARADASRSRAILLEIEGQERQRLAESAIRLRYAQARARVARDSLLPLARRVRGRATSAYQAGESSITQLLDALRAERDVAAEAIDDLLTWQEARATWDQVRGQSR